MVDAGTLCLLETLNGFPVIIFERYCKCEMPYNPDDLMIQCDECKDWCVSYIPDFVAFMFFHKIETSSRSISPFNMWKH